MAQRGNNCDNTGNLLNGYMPFNTGFNTKIYHTIFETRLANKHFCIKQRTDTCHELLCNSTSFLTLSK